MRDFDVGKTSVQVKGGGRFGQPGITRGNRFRNGCVLGGGRGKPLCVVGGQAADPDQVHAQAAHGLGQIGVGNSRVDGGVETARELVVGMAAGIAAVDQLRSLEELKAELFEGCGVAALGGQGGRLAFKGFAQFEQLVDVVKRNIGDDDAAAPAVVVRPSAVSRLRASRRGVREIPSRSDCSTSASTVPGRRRHSMMSSRNAA